MGQVKHKDQENPRVEFAERVLVRIQSNELCAGLGYILSVVAVKDDCSVWWTSSVESDCDTTLHVERKEIEIAINAKLECVERLCYLGDLIGAVPEEASRPRSRCAWTKFMELTPILTSRGASLAVKCEGEGL